MCFADGRGSLTCRRLVFHFIYNRQASLVIYLRALFCPPCIPPYNKGKGQSPSFPVVQAPPRGNQLTNVILENGCHSKIN